MEKLLEAIAAVVCLLSPEKVQAIASKIRLIDPDKAVNALTGIVGTPLAKGVVERLIDIWQVTSVKADELASMLLAANYVYTKTSTEQSVELVWTGPTTSSISARRTEQALLEVINAAKATLFITSFVAYDISSIVNALNSANDRGVFISMLLESSEDYGGSISIDVIGKMRSLVPSARLYAWRDKPYPFLDGCVHAKVAVADDNICFITSANLTAYAMEKNMEAGVLISGGKLPQLLDHHLHSLVATKIVSQV